MESHQAELLVLAPWQRCAGAARWVLATAGQLVLSAAQGPGGSRANTHCTNTQDQLQVAHRSNKEKAEQQSHKEKRRLSHTTSICASKCLG